MKKDCILYCDLAPRRRSNLIEIASRRVKSDYISQYIVYSFNPNQTPKAPKWYSIGK